MDPESFADAVGWPAPRRLGVLLALRAAEGDTVLDGPDGTWTAGLHPLLVPLWRDPEGGVGGLLRWPTPHPGMDLPLVHQAPGTPWTLTLVDRSVDAHLVRALATADATSRPPPPSLEEVAAALHPPGTVGASGLPLAAWLLRHVGARHDELETRALAFLERGDAMAAQVTADRACRGSEGWARPHGFRARLLARLGALDEARDAAATAFTEPVWTLGGHLDQVARLAGWSRVTSVGYRRLLARAEKPPADRAAHLLDACAIEGGDWDGVREPVAALYREAGLEAVARWVAGP